MTRKNRQKHRQNDRQFAPLPSGMPAPRRTIMAGSQAGPQQPSLRCGPAEGQAVGLSQEELAERAGLSARTVGDLERVGSYSDRGSRPAPSSYATAMVSTGCGLVTPRT